MSNDITAKDIKQLAEKLGGYEELAVKCHVRHQTVYKWVKRTKPHKSNLVAIQGLIEELERAGESLK